jgi:tellurite resistance protein TerC
VPNLLQAEFFGTQLWTWIVFLGLVATMLALDLGISQRRARTMGARESLGFSAFYIAVALLFGAWVWQSMGREAGLAFYTAFFVEKSLALDNVFVISMIFTYFATPPRLQHRVLVWGVLGVIVLRALLIGAGTSIVASAHWVLFLFGAFLIFTGIKMLVSRSTHGSVGDQKLLHLLRRHLRVTEQYHGDRFFVRVREASRMRRVATPLFLALVMVEAADLVFAIDSVPAVLAITTDPFLVYTSNIFAILGLRALYFALAAMVARFAYLKVSLALILVFVGGKIFWAELVAKPDPLISLAAIALMLGGGIAASLLRPPRTAI